MNPLSLITLLSGLVFFLGGLFLRVFPPKKINPLVGYRTGSSMRNPETWEAANLFAAKLMMLLGLVLTGIGMFAFWFQPTPLTGLMAGILILVLVVFLIIYFTEQHLKKHFDEQGRRRK